MLGVLRQYCPRDGKTDLAGFREALAGAPGGSQRGIQGTPGMNG